MIMISTFVLHTSITLSPFHFPPALLSSSSTSQIQCITVLAGATEPKFGPRSQHLLPRPNTRITTSCSTQEEARRSREGGWLETARNQRLRKRLRGSCTRMRISCRQMAPEEMTARIFMRPFHTIMCHCPLRHVKLTIYHSYHQGQPNNHYRYRQDQEKHCRPNIIIHRQIHTQDHRCQYQPNYRQIF